MTHPSDDPQETQLPETESGATSTPSHLSHDERVAQGKDLFQKNLKYLASRYPSFHKSLLQHQPQTELIYTEEGEPDLKLGDTLLYNGVGAHTHTKEQMEKFWKDDSNRLLLTSPVATKLDPHADIYFKALLKKAEKEGISIEKKPFSRESHTMVVLGMGLGPHIKELIETTKCKQLIIFDTTPEFFYQSAHTFDWEETLAPYKNMQLHIHVLQDPRQIFGVLRNLSRNNPAKVDGLTFYLHHPTNTFMRCRDLINQEGHLLLTGLGFFEDEINMVRNSYRNLAMGASHVLAPQSKTQPLPVILCGGGPSLDEGMKVIQENKDRAIIMSCGSALNPLLDAGIKPDFHFYLERAEISVAHHRSTAEHHDLSGICFVGTTTVFPGVTELFDESIMFFRPGLSVFPLFSLNDEQGLPGCDPEVLNAGMAFSLKMNFREFYLFGADMGSRDPAYHHAKSSWPQKGQAMTVRTYTIPQPGNFGGTIYSHPNLIWVRESIEAAIRFYAGGQNFYNCSNGARIEYTTPKHPGSVKMKDPATPKADTVRVIIDGFPVYEKKNLKAIWTKANLAKAIPEYCQKLLDLAPTIENLDKYDDCTQIMSLMQPTRIDSFLPMLFRGSLSMFLMATEYLRSRIPDPDHQAVYARIAREEYEALVVNMRDQALTDFAALEAETPLD